MEHRPTRVLLLGAHPDDAEFHAGGLLCQHARAGSQIRLISVTNGQSGHHELDDGTLIAMRRLEAQAAGNIIGCEYRTWDFADGYLTASLEVRDQIIREIRAFQPDLVLTHRSNDYHPDHRAVGQAVQDASYLVTVPKIAPDVPALRRDPVVAFMPDAFTRPTPLRADAVLDASDALDTIVAMLDCHTSQVYQWLPYNEGILDQVPNDRSLQHRWLKGWLLRKLAWRAPRFWNSQWSTTLPQLVEAFEISEYAGKLDASRFAALFPGCQQITHPQNY